MPPQQAESLLDLFDDPLNFRFHSNILAKSDRYRRTESRTLDGGADDTHAQPRCKPVARVQDIQDARGSTMAMARGLGPFREGDLDDEALAAFETAREQGGA
jgi:hypothetical protein